MLDWPALTHTSPTSTSRSVTVLFAPAITSAAPTVFAGRAGNVLHFERRHRAIVDRFGRYPHRNEALGRVSTAEELAFLQEPGSRF